MRKKYYDTVADARNTKLRKARSLKKEGKNEEEAIIDFLLRRPLQYVAVRSWFQNMSKIGAPDN